MAVYFVILLIVVAFFLYFKRVFTLDSRIDKKVLEDGLKDHKRVLNIREPHRNDGQNPFKGIKISGIGFGVPIKKNFYYRIVEVEGVVI